jgi:hypothetical protein
VKTSISSLSFYSGVHKVFSQAKPELPAKNITMDLEFRGRRRPVQLCAFQTAKKVLVAFGVFPQFGSKR